MTAIRGFSNRLHFIPNSRIYISEKFVLKIRQRYLRQANYHDFPILNATITAITYLYHSSAHLLCSYNAKVTSSLS